MYTQCPHCLAVFVVEASRIGSAHGHVRCGQCEALFDALPTLCDELPPGPYVTLPRQDGAAPPPQLDALVPPPEPAELMTAAAADAPLDPRVAPSPEIRPVADSADPLATRSETLESNPQPTSAPTATGAGEWPDGWPRPMLAQGETSAVDRESLAAIELSAEAEIPQPSAPGFVDRRGRQRALRWRLMAGALVLLLAAQACWLARGELIRFAPTRPALLDLCRVLRLPPPLVSAPSRLQLDAQDIRRHPEVPGALLISASLRNAAPWPQPYPLLQVQLSDLSGRAVAERVFAPAAYLPDAAIADHGLPAGARAAISIEVRDPGPRAVAFQIRIAPPDSPTGAE